MGWTLLAPIAALLAAGAAQSISCPGSIYYAVNETGNPARESYGRKNASSLDDCVAQCYGNQFCFSAVFFTHAPDDYPERCRLSYVSSYHCNSRKLVTGHVHKASHTTVECLRCPANGELEENIVLPVESESEEETAAPIEITSTEATTEQTTTNAPSTTTAEPTTTQAPTTEAPTTVTETTTAEATSTVAETTTTGLPTTTTTLLETTTTLQDTTTVVIRTTHPGVGNNSLFGRSELPWDTNGIIARQPILTKPINSTVQSTTKAAPASIQPPTTAESDANTTETTTENVSTSTEALPTTNTTSTTVAETDAPSTTANATVDANVTATTIPATENVIDNETTTDVPATTDAITIASTAALPQITETEKLEKPELPQENFLVIKENQEIPSVCPSGAQPEMGVGGEGRNCSRTSDCSRHSRCHQPSPDAPGRCCFVVPPAACSPSQTAYVSECRAAYLPFALPSLGPLLSRQPHLELGLESDCASFDAFAACRDSSPERCADVGAELMEYVCLSETRLLLRATRYCRAEPVYRQPLEACLAAFEREEVPKCQRIKELKACVSAAAAGACGTPELSDVLSALIMVAGRDCARPLPTDAAKEVEGDKVPQTPPINATTTAPEATTASNSTTSSPDNGTTSVPAESTTSDGTTSVDPLLAALHARHNCTAAQEESLSACLMTSLAPLAANFGDAADGGFQPDFLGNFSATLEMCGGFGAYETCAATAIGDSACLGYLDGLVKGLLGRLCSVEGLAVLAGAEGCVSALTFKEELSGCAVGFAALDLGGQTDLREVCAELGELSTCAVQVTGDMCGEELGALVGLVLDDMRAAHFAQGCGEEVAISASSDCVDVAFVAAPPLEKTEFEDKADAVDAAECARLCAQRACTLAGFNPMTANTSLTSTGVCLLSFVPREAQCTAPRVHNVEATEPILISCLVCRDTALAIEPPPISQTERPETQAPTTQTTTVTPTSSSTVLPTTTTPLRTTTEEISVGPRELRKNRECPGSLSFVGVTLGGGAGPGPSVPLFAAQEAAPTAEACARRCFQDAACTGAGYNPPLQAGLGGVCLFSFQESSQKCDGRGRLFFFKPNAPALLLCIACEPTTTTGGTSTPPRTDEGTKSTADATTPTTTDEGGTTQRRGIHIITQGAPALVQDIPTTTPPGSTRRMVVITAGQSGDVGSVAVKAPQIQFASTTTTTKATTAKTTTTTTVPPPTTTETATSTATTATVEEEVPSTTRVLPTTEVEKLPSDLTTLEAVTEALASETALPQDRPGVQFSEDGEKAEAVIKPAVETDKSAVSVVKIKKAEACPDKISFKPLPIAADSDLFKVAFVRSLSEDASRVFTVREGKTASAMACARLCRDQGCTIAAFRPRGIFTGECVLSFKKVDLPCPNTKRVSTFVPTTPVLIMCLQCEASPAPTLPPPTTAAAVQRCGSSESVAFYATELTPSLPVPLPQFQDKVMAADEPDCARLCYERRCTSAGFYPSESGSAGGLCLMSMERRHPSVALCAQHEERYQAWTHPRPTLLLCMDCEPTRESTLAPVTTTRRTPTKLITAATVEPLGITTLKAAVSAPKDVFSGAHIASLSTKFPKPVQACSGSVEFGVSALEAAGQLGAFDLVAPADSPKACAALCHSHNCTLAAFKPAKSLDGILDASTCLLGFGAPSPCASTTAVRAYVSAAPVLIRCVTCNEKLSVISSPRSESKSETKTLRKTTAAPLKPGEVKCFNCVAQNSGACDANECVGTFCIVQAIQDPSVGLKIAQSCSVAEAPAADGCTRHSNGGVAHTVCVCRDQFCNDGARVERELGWNNLTRAASTPGPTPKPRDRNDPDVGITDFKPSRGSAARLPQALIPECAAGIIFRPKRGGDSQSAVRAGFKPTYRLRKNTPGACAEICYYTGCSEAHYTPAEKLCMLSYQSTAEEVRSDCNAIKGGFVREYRGAPIYLSCVICGAPIDDAIATTTPPAPPPLLLPVIREAEEEDFPFHFGTTILSTPQPRRVESAAPPSAAPPRLSSRQTETRRPTTTERATTVARTSAPTTRTPTTRPRPTNPPPRKAPANQDDSNCVVSFQAAKNQDTTRVLFENSTSVATSTDCAKACYRLGCSIAEFIPPPAGPYRNLQKLGACYLGFQEPDACETKEQRHFVYDSDDVVDLTCVRCVRVGLGGASVDEAPSLSANILLAPAVAAAEGGGCEPSFEVVEAAAAITALGAQFFHRVEEVSSVAACAGVCLQREGCTLAGYDGDSRLCMLGKPKEGKANACDSLPRLRQFVAVKQVIIQCLRCGFDGRISEPRPESTISGLNLPSLPLPPASRTCSGRVSFEVSSVRSESGLRVRHVSRDVRHAADCARLCFGLSGCKIGGWEPSSGECRMYFGSVGSPCEARGRRHDYRLPMPVWLQCFRCEDSAAALRSVDEIRRSEIRFIGPPRDAGLTKAFVPDSYVPKRACSGASFQKRVLSAFNPAEYSRSLALSSAQACARACYELECTNAAYDPRDFMCYLSFNFEICQAAVGRVMTHGTDESIAIQCIKCIADSLPSSLRSIDAAPRVRDRQSFAPVVRGLKPEIDAGTPCGGRLVFQTAGVRLVPRLNVTNDVPASSPADCARRCWDIGCKAAGYIPNPVRAGGVCLLSSDAPLCAVGAPLVPQVSEASPVLISCIHCTGCAYRVRRGVASASLPPLEVQRSARDVSECAAECGRLRGCVAAAFSPRATLGNCLLALAKPGQQTCGASERLSEAAFGEADSAAPLVLDCLDCRA